MLPDIVPPPIVTEVEYVEAEDRMVVAGPRDVEVEVVKVLLDEVLLDLSAPA